MQNQIDESPVLIIGAGPAGLTAAAALARAGIETLLLERRLEPSRMPRATAVSTGSMELMRAWGLEEELREGELGVDIRPWVCDTLAAADAGHAVDAGFPTREQSELISPTAPAGIPQDHLEPVLERHVRSLPAARIERGTEVIAVDTGGAGVTVRARDLPSGRERRIRSRYLLAADGVRSTVRAALRIPVSLRERVGERIVVLFRAPLWELVGEHRYAIYFINEPPSSLVPAGLPDRWVFGAESLGSGVDRASDLTEGDVTRSIRAAAGYPALEPRIESIGRVRFLVDVAARFREGGAFLLGDAAHRVTPRGATGLNAAIRDGFDIGWKLAWVLRGWADDALLDSYEAERRPVAEHNAARSADPNGSESPVTAELRADLGGRIPHLWLRGEPKRLSTLDLLTDGLTLFTGSSGPAWDDTAGRAARTGPPVTVRRLDELSARALGISPGGALLVRPDGVPTRLWADERLQLPVLAA